MSAARGVGAHTDRPKSQREAARRAGMSKHQEMQAIRIASIPPDAFEELVESEHPPTPTAMAEIGLAYRRGVVPTVEPPRSDLTSRTISELRRLANFTADAVPATVAHAMAPGDLPEALHVADRLLDWVETLAAHIRHRRGQEADR